MANVINVLIIDGSAFACNYLSNILKNGPYFVRAVSGIAEGFLELSNRDYDVVFVSYQLGVMNGVQFKDFYIDSKGGSSGERFILTYGFETQLISECVNDFLDVLPKPLNPVRVMSVLAKLNKLNILT